MKKKGYETRYGGIGPCRIDPEPANPIKKEDIDWTDIIITARKKHKPILIKDYQVKGKRIICLEVSDSRYKAYLKNPEWANISQEEYNKLWTYPQLRKAIKKYLPFE